MADLSKIPVEDYQPAPPPSPDPAPANRLVQNAPGAEGVQNPYEALVAGWRMSPTGLVESGGKPVDTSIPKNAGFFTGLADNIAETAGSLAGSVVPSVVGAVAGGIATADTGPGAVAGAALGGAVVPQAVRETMLDYYKSGHSGAPMTATDFTKMVATSAWNIAKGTAESLPLLGGEGGAVPSGFSAPAKANAFVNQATELHSQVEPKMPDAQDFTVQAHGVAPQAYKAVQPQLEGVYRQAGTTPWEAANAAKADPKLHEELTTHDVNGDPVIPKFNAQAEAEPEPFKTNPGKIASEHEAEMAGIEGGGVRDNATKGLLKHVVGASDDAISPTGAVGRYQVQPGLARQFGLDPERLTDPKYNEAAATHILTQLSAKYHGDPELILAHYTAGPKAAATMMLNGKDTSEMPPATQQALVEAGYGGKGGKPPEPPTPPQEPPEPPEGEEPDYTKLNTDMRLLRFKDAIGEEPTQSGKAPLGLEFELDAAKRVDNVLKTRGLLDPDSKELNIEDMFRQTYGSESRANHFFDQGPIDPITFERKPGVSLREIADEIKSFGGNKDEFNLYRVSLRTIEKAKQGIDTGIFKGGLKEAIDNASDPKLKRYAKANDMMQTFKRGVLEYVRDSHGISQGQMDAMEKMNTSHVSLRRIMGDDAPFAASKGRRMFGSNPIKAMEGSDRQIVDPWTADIDNARQMIRFADRNRAAMAVVQSERQMEALGIKRLSDQSTKATLAEPGSNVFKPYGMDPKQEAAVTPLTVEGTGKGNTFRVYENGKPVTYEAKDPNLARLVRGADTPAEATLISKVAQFPAKLERAGIAFAPDFGPRVLLKHQMTAFILDPAHPPPFLTMLRGSLSAINKDEAFWGLARNGGLTGAITNLDHEYMDTEAQHLLDTTGFSAKAFNAVKHPLQFAQLITERMTAATRIGYSARQKAAGVPAAKAAMQGRKAYLDYDEKFVSDIANNWAKWVPFFKADILGLKQGWDAIQPGRLGNTALFATLGLVLPQVAMYALNRKQDESLPVEQRYTSLPQWERDLYFVSPQIGGTRFKLGKPYNVGPMLGIPLERFLEHTYEQDPHAFDDVIRQMTGSEEPNITPAIAKPVVEGMANYNFFTGLPLVSDSLKAASADAQYTDATSEVAKRLSALIGDHPTPAVQHPLQVANVSPIVLDNYVEEWGGSIGATLLHTLDAPLGKVSGPFDAGNLPFVRGFLVRNPGMSTQQISDFYTDAAKIESLAVDKSLEIKRNQGPQAVADFQAVGKKLTLVRGIEHVLAVQRASLKGINENKTMSVDEKRQASENIYKQAWTLSVVASRALEAPNGP